MKYLYLLFFAILFSSCGDDFKEEYEERRIQIVGTWEINETKKTVVLGEIINSEQNVHLIQFNSDGTAIKTIEETMHMLTWIYQPSPEKIALNGNPNSANQGIGLLAGNNHFDIIENNPTHQSWNINGNVQDVIDSNIHSFITVVNWELIKQ